jgi:tetratricopeptide (TPR) repeat protein
MRATINYMYTFAVISAGLLLLTGCSDKSTEPGNGTDPVALERIAEGWTSFSQKNYQEARAKFDEALSRLSTTEEDAPYRAEALTGKAWSRGMLREYLGSRADFNSGINITQIQSAVRRDANAGLAFVEHALRNYEAAVTAGDAVFSGGVSTYQFQYDNRINAQRVRLVIALSAYNLGNFQKVAQQMDLIVPANAPHSTDPAELLKAMSAFEAGLP